MSNKPEAFIAYTLLQGTTEQDLQFHPEFIHIADVLMFAVREYQENALGGEMADAMYALGALAEKYAITFGNVVEAFYEYLEEVED